MLSALKYFTTLKSGKVTIITGAIYMFQDVCQYQFKTVLLCNSVSIY